MASCSSSTGHEADEHDGQSAQRGLLELFDRGEAVDVRRQRLEVEGAQQQRCRQLLHAVDEDEQRRGAERRHQQRQVHAPQGRQRAFAQRARRGVEAGRDAVHAGLDRRQRDGEEADHVGERDGEQRAGEQQSRRDAERGAHEVVDAIVDAGERDQQADGEHRARHGIAERRDAPRRSG